MFSMQLQGIQVDQDVVYVAHGTDIQEVPQYIIDEPLEGHWGVAEAKRHYLPFIGPIPCAEGHLWLIPFQNAHQVVHILQVNFGVDSGWARGVHKIWY